jgi:hypothetical protein
VAFVVVATASVATAAQATNWLTGLQAAPKGQAQAELAPTPPTGVTLTCVSSTQKVLKVSWNSVPHATYDIFYSNTNATSGFATATTGVTTTTWTSGALPTATYWVQVSANVGTNWKSANAAATPSRVIKGTAPNCA